MDKIDRLRGNTWRCVFLNHAWIDPNLSYKEPRILLQIYMLNPSGIKMSTYVAERQS